MRRLIVLLMSCLAIQAIAQDYEPGQIKFWRGFGSDSLYLSAESTYFKQDKYIIGWHWAGERKISSALLANQHDTYHNFNNSGLVSNNTLLFVKPLGYSHAVGADTLNARAIQYEPTLLLDQNYPEKLVTRTGDTTRPVFGFLKRRGRIETNPANVNFNRLIIDSVALQNQVILEEPWPSNQITMFYGSKRQPDSILNSHLCRTLYISINLRRPGNSMGNDPLLKIEMPYKLFNNNNIYNIRFNLIPDTLSNGYDSLTNQRGLIRRLIQTPNNNLQEFIITRDMIPPGNRDITISAFFKCDGLINSNHELKQDFPESGKIDSLKIKITKLGTDTLMLDWVRIETPHARRFLQGANDSALGANTQADLIKFFGMDYSIRGIRMFRYNTIVEGRLSNWIAEKYFNKLIGNISTNEVNVIYPFHYEQYVNPPDRWFGTYKAQFNVSVPFSRMVYGKSSPNLAKTMGLINGYMGINNGVDETNITKSHYETYLINNCTPLNINYFLVHPEKIDE